MNSREQILNAVKANQPTASGMPKMPIFDVPFDDNAFKFKTTLEALGGECYYVDSMEAIMEILEKKFPAVQRVVSTLPGLMKFAKATSEGHSAHDLSNVDVAIIPAHFGVAENGAVWVTDELLLDNALPFIAQHLVAIVKKQSLVATMHEAYSKIGGSDYSFGTFIAGPSKTADIEQSLVLGAHGAKSMLVFLLND